VSPPYHIEKGSDGSIWVEGDGLSLELDSMEQAQAFIRRLSVDHDQALTDYLMGDLEEI
jgi:hypothetical protein